jgi:hypothetical protein
MWSEILLSIGGTAVLGIGTYNFGKFCERKKLSLSLYNLECANKDYLLKTQNDLEEIQGLIKEHKKLLNLLDKQN